LFKKCAAEIGIADIYNKEDFRNKVASDNDVENKHLEMQELLTQTRLHSC
jgi:hypothetical protein